MSIPFTASPSLSASIPGTNNSSAVAVCKSKILNMPLLPKYNRSSFAWTSHAEIEVMGRSIETSFSFMNLLKGCGAHFITKIDFGMATERIMEDCMEPIDKIKKDELATLETHQR